MRVTAPHVVFDRLVISGQNVLDDSGGLCHSVVYYRVLELAADHDRCGTRT
jgi:hypothetical protein